jgi:p21-activated kinase 1
MDIRNSSNTNGTSQRRKLTKKPPTHKHSSSTNFADGQPPRLHSKTSFSSLRRAPSAPPQRQRTTPTHSLSASNNSSPRHLPTTAKSSNQPSPVLPTGEFLPSTFSPRHHQPAPPTAFPVSPVDSYSAAPRSSGGSGTTGSAKTREHRLSDPHLQTLNLNTSEELVGAPFDGISILQHLETTRTQGYQHFSSRRPPPPLIHAQTSPVIVSPPLRQSASFSVDAPAAMSLSEKAQQGAPSQLPNSKRYSDESKEPKGGPGVLRKKSGFSGLMSTLVGSPKKPVISAPENPVHVTHVGYDSSTGQFTVRLLQCAPVLLCVFFGYFAFL